MEVLSKLRKKAKSKDSEIEIQSIQQTRSGDVLMELGSKTKNKEIFYEAIREDLL